MDYEKIFISSVLLIIFYFLFGHESIGKLMQDEMAISHTEHEPKIIKAPGCYKKKFSQCKNLFTKECFC